ncbi:beta strand repeat-containing protein [Singulisphaera sp. PoT]|uniref:beta strand repeat-containing protein n=1 Tax=Singulisphaera sp. PoT TaxID=3411797 RepID=UPI003BF536F0
MSTISGWKVLRREIFGSSRRRGRRRPGSFTPGLSVLEGRIALSTLVVTDTNDSGAGSFRQAIIDAHGGDKITFANSLRGHTITLTSGELEIDRNIDIEGPGAGQLTVSGNGASRVFFVTPDASATIAGLTITDGKAGEGGGILNYGNLLLQKATVTANQALGALDDYHWAQGGGISNGGILTIVQSTITGNKAIGNDDIDVGGQSSGGGIFNTNLLSITGSTISNNLAIGGTGSQFSGSSLGGGIADLSDPSLPVALRIVNSTLSNNQAIGQDAGGGGPFASSGTGSGGALFLGNETAIISGSSFIGNRAVGGDGGISGAYGGAIDGSGVLTITGSAFTANQAIGGKGIDAAPGSFSIGGTADGGAIMVSSPALTITGSTFTSNMAIGGDGGTSDTFSFGGNASAGALSYAQVGDTAPGATITGSQFTNNQAISGRGDEGQGGQASAGAIEVNGSYEISFGFTGFTLHPTNMTITGTTITGNLASAGDGMTGGPAFGAGVAASFGNLAITGSTLTSNLAIGGDGEQGGLGGQAQGGGLTTIGGNATLTGTLVANNQAIGGAGGSGVSGGGGGGGSAQGGGISMAPSSLDLFAGWFGLSVPVSTLTINGGALTGNLVEGGAGGKGNGSGAGGVGGTASGGGVSTTSNTVLTIKNSLLSGDAALGGLGAQGAATGGAYGGAIFVGNPLSFSLPPGTLNMTDTLVVGNLADGNQGLGGGIYFDTGSVSNLTRTLVIGNRASTAGNNTYNA